MNPYLLGKISALSKFAELSHAVKTLLEHAAMGAVPGAAMGGITGAVAAPEGKRLQGAGQGALAGGLTGGAIGAGGRALFGGPLDGFSRIKLPNNQGVMRVRPGPDDGVSGALGSLMSGGAGTVGGSIAGAAAAPNEDTMWEKLKGKLGLG